MSAVEAVEPVEVGGSRWKHVGSITPADERVYGVWTYTDTEQVEVCAEPQRQRRVYLAVGDDNGTRVVGLTVEDAREVGWTLLRAARQVEECDGGSVVG